MELRTFGPEKKKVSRIGFGGAPAGLKNYQEKFDPKDKGDRRLVIDAIEYAYDNGINYFDTAPGYGEGESERIIGEALMGVESHKLYIATKAGIGSYDDVIRSVEMSLTNLKRDSLDLVQIHGTHYNNIDEKQIMGDRGTLAALEHLKKSSLVKSIGFTSEDNNNVVYRFINSGRFDMMQIAYNLILQHPYDPVRPFGSMIEAKDRGMGVVTMRAATSTVFQKWIQKVNPENTYDYTPSLIQFCLSNPLIDVVLVGMRHKNIVRKNIEIEENTKDRIDIKELHQKYV